MQSSKLLENERQSLVGQCVRIFRQGIDLIESLPDELFAGGKESGKSSVGAHFRHNLDFVTNFLAGIESGKLDYHSRERNPRVETDRVYAASRIREAVARLENLTSENLSANLLVRSETVENLWCRSTALRELEFLQSHTVHHYALIEMKLAARGFFVPKCFGVAPSTLEFWKSQTA